MRLNEFEDLNLAINFHNELNPRLWDKGRLQPKVRKALLNIANHFKDFLGIDMFDILDITISGSNAAFTYTPKSDIDLHLVVMIPEEHEAELKELFNAKKYQYNDQHNITVRGFNVELYVQDAEDAHHSMGIFSVSKNTWIKKPKKQRAQIDDIEVQEKYRGIKHRINQAIVSDNFDAVQKLWRSIKNMRQTGLEQGGEFSPENLAFKILRADGSLDKLSKHMGHLEDQGLSIDEEVEAPPPKTKSEVYLDMDGVLADFFAEYAVLAGLPRGSSYRDIPPAKADPTLNKMIGTDFFARLPKFPTADSLVRMVTKVFGHYNICSSPLRGDFENSEQQKTVWIQEHLSPQPRRIIITPRKEKHATQPDGTPNVLIDDRGDNISKWEAAGGVGIKYQADEDGLDVITQGLKRALKIIAGEEHLEPQKLKSLDRSMPVAVGRDEEINEAVGGNYLYHATDAAGLAGILQSGAIRAASAPQKATAAQTRLPTVSVTRDWGYASGSNASNQMAGIGRDAVLVLDRTAIENNFKTLGTSQNTNIKGQAFNPYLKKDGEARSQNTDPMARTNAKAKAQYAEPTAKAGGEFEEAIPVRSGALPIKNSLVGFWVNPKSALTKNPTVMNDPRRLDMPRPNQFVKAAKQEVPALEDRHPNDRPYGPETKPTMPKGTVRVDVSDVYDWYKLGMNISDLKKADKSQFGKGPPSTIVSFGDEDTEHKYIKDLENLGLATTDIDPVDPDQPRGMKRQKTDPTFNVDENFDDGRNPQDKGDSRRHGIPKKASLGSLDKIVHSKTASPRKKQLAHWQANMRRGRKK